MFKIKISQEIVNHCKDQIQKYNFGRRSFANGTPEQQYTGILGQCVLMELFGLPLIDGSEGCDNGQDINYKGLMIDVKTMGRKGDVFPNYVNNLMGVQYNNFHPDLYIFCSLNKTNGELTVCGWIPKIEVKRKADHFPIGSVRTRRDGTKFATKAELYEIPNRNLYDVNSFDELVSSIDTYYNK